MKLQITKLIDIDSSATDMRFLIKLNVLGVLFQINKKLYWLILSLETNLFF